MKEWLKEFVFALTGEHLDYTIDQYLRNHPLPLPTDEEIDIQASLHFDDDSIHKHLWTGGAKWCRKKMEGKL